MDDFLAEDAVYFWNLLEAPFRRNDVAVRQPSGADLDRAVRDVLAGLSSDNEEMFCKDVIADAAPRLLLLAYFAARYIHEDLCIPLYKEECRPGLFQRPPKPHVYHRTASRQGLTLVHFSAQLESCLTQ
jgi:hypothetical protein